jgi:D-glycero-alpha-D-manno-heptose-7-phosphate kinase
MIQIPVMIISKTPLRMSFFGGGTDLPVFYEKEFGCVISTSIDKYVYIVTHPSFKGNNIIVYSKREAVDSIEDIQHPIVREAMKKLRVDNGIEIHSLAEVPAGTGLGSSSSFTVGMLNLLYATQGKSVSKFQLAKEACEIEIDTLKEPIGKQDQYAAAFGGFNSIKFNSDGSVSVESLKTNKETLKKLDDRLVLFYLDNTREASSVLSEQTKNIQSDKNKFETMKKMKEITIKMKEELDKDNISNFGRMLHESWLLKKSAASKISNPLIDEVYNKGIAAGAEGGKVLGAGGGGFILFYCEPEKQESLRAALKDLREFKFGFDTEGTRIVYSQ